MVSLVAAELPRLADSASEGVAAVAGHVVRSWREPPDRHVPPRGPGGPVSDGTRPG
jgi:hypothetical protein